MRKLIFLCTILLSQIVITAQINFKTNLGFKAGLNNSDVVGTEKNGTATGFTDTTFYGGFFADTKLAKNTSLENELLFSMTNDYFFLELPIHIKQHVFKKIFVFYGTKLDFASTDRRPDYEIEPLGISGEIGTQYLLTNKLFLELRYSHGFTKQINDNVLEILNARRNTLRLGIGVKF